MTINRQQFLSLSRQLTATLGDFVPPCTAQFIRQAEQLLAEEPCPAWVGQRAPESRWLHHVYLKAGILTPLASAYRHTGDERFARGAREHIEAFLRVYPVGEDWAPAAYDGQTSYPYRIGSVKHGGWLGTLPAFLGSPAFDDAFVDTLLEAALLMLRYLAAHVYPGRNIRITHGGVLLVNGLRLAFLPEAEAWQHLGVRILNDAVARQLLPDGADAEGSAEYHGDVLRELAPFWKLARARPELGLRIPTEKLAAMFAYTRAVTRPDNAETAMNDSSYYPSHGHFPDRLAAIREEFFALAGIPEPQPALCQCFPDVGQVFLRDSWGPEATYLTFDATTRHGWHWHPSRNAVQLFAHGRALLVDPGYPLSTGEYGQQTAHHSTLNINGLDQSHAVARLRHRHAEGYDLVEGLYGGGYWPVSKEARHGAGIFAEHHRVLLWIHQRCAVVLDYLYTMPERGTDLTIESVWQLSEGDAQLGDDRRSAHTCHPDGNLLLLFPLTLDGTEIAVHTGEASPMRGWVPDRGRTCYLPAAQVRLWSQQRDPWKSHLAAVLVPYAGTDVPPVTATATHPSIGFFDRTAGRLDLHWPDGARDLLVWTGRLEEAIDAQHGLDTDAALVHLAFTPTGDIMGGLMVDGTYVRYDGQEVGEMMHRV